MTDLPTLENLFGAYFHQDWAMEHDSVASVVEGYRASESAETVAAARDELTRLRSLELDEVALGARIRALGCEYHPGDGGWHAFLDTVEAGLSPRGDGTADA